MSEPITKCPLCLHNHPADLTCQQVKEMEAARFTKQLANEAMDYSARNPLVALAHAENWPKPEGDLLAALHQNTGIPFMCDYILSACDEGILSHLPKPLDAMSPREIMREFKAAWERRQIVAATSDNIDPKASRLATPEEHATLINCLNQHRGAAEPEPMRLDLSHLSPEQIADWKHQFTTQRPTSLIVYMGKGEGEEFMIGDTTYKPEDAPAIAAAPQDGSKVTGYRKLSDDDIAQMNVFKSVSRSFAREIDTYKAHLEGVLNGPAMLSAEQAQQHRDALRWLAIARTDVQTACMAACRAVAKPESDC